MASPILHSTRRRTWIRKPPQDPVRALEQLLDCADPTELFDRGLALLVRHFRAELAFISRSTDLGMEVFWWATADGAAPDPELQAQVHALCPRVLEEPRGALLHRHGGGSGPGRTYLGVPLDRSGRVEGVLSLLSGGPGPFSLGGLALARAVAALIGKTLQVEQLKYEVHQAREALELTRAVMEDGALREPRTDLPSLRHLDVWLKPTLALAKRTGEAMAVVLWRLPGDPDGLQAVARDLRGEDLLVALGHEEFLLLLPRTDPQGTLPILEHARAKLGPLAMGATLWHPGAADDPHLRQAQSRARTALFRSQEAGEAAVVWELPEPHWTGPDPARLRSR